MTLTQTPPPKRGANKIKKYELIVSIFASQHQAGAGLSTNIFGTYDTLEECEEAGLEAKASFQGYQGSLYYACVPTYRKNYV